MNDINDINDNNTYLLVIITMVLLIIIFGGYNKNTNLQIEYNLYNYQYLNSLIYFEKELQKYNHGNFELLQITNKLDLSECLIPNVIDIFFVNIKPKTYFNIINYVSEHMTKLMVIFNHNLQNINLNSDNLMLLLQSKNEFNNNNCKNY